MSLPYYEQQHTSCSFRYARAWCRKTLRTKYVNKLGSAFNKDGRFASVLLDESTWILDSMELPPGTAKNQALRENVFVLLVCIYNKIPVFVRVCPSASSANLG